jgi:hypothetical protein
MLFQIIKKYLLALALVAQAFTAYAAPAQLAPMLDTDLLTPDGQLSLDFAYRPDLNFDPKAVSIVVTYRPTKPDAPGVKIIRYEVVPHIRIPEKTYREAPESKTLNVKPEWVSVLAANKFMIQFPERLQGPGDYQAKYLTIERPTKMREEEWISGFFSFLSDSDLVDSSLGIQKINDGSQHNLSFDRDKKKRYTYAYKGRHIYVSSNLGSYLSKAKILSQETHNSAHMNSFEKELQDASGRWHISESQPRSLCGASYYVDTNTPKANAKDYPSMAWALAFDTLYLPTFYHQERSTDQYECISLKAAGLPENKEAYESRIYYYRNNKLWARDVSRFEKNASTQELVEFDVNGELLFYFRENASGKNKTKLRWSRLEQLAYPELKQPAPFVDAATLQSQGDDAIKMLELHYPKPKPQ